MVYTLHASTSLCPYFINLKTVTSRSSKATPAYLARESLASSELGAFKDKVYSSEAPIPPRIGPTQ